jgi:hypothetical protein
MAFITFRGIPRRPDNLLGGNTVNVSRHLDSPNIIQAVHLCNWLIAAQGKKTNNGVITKMLYEKSGSNGFVLSILFICSGEREISRVCKFSRNCSTLRPPTIGNTYGVFRRWYAMATEATNRVSGHAYSVQQTIV